MASRELTVHTLNEFIHYHIFPESRQIVITWDTSNDELNYLMRNEYRFLGSSEYYNNSLWVNEMKKVIGWDFGMCFILEIHSYLTNERLVIQISSGRNNISSYSLRIDEYGYLGICPNYNNYMEYIRCHCLYNDMLDEENEPYVLK